MILKLKAKFRRWFPQTYKYLGSLREKHFSSIIDRIYFLSFPKSGRTWLRMLIGRAFMEQHNLNGSIFPLNYRLIRETENGFPRITVTHSGEIWENRKGDVKLLQDTFGRKILLLVRDPRDVIVSLYYHRRYRNQTFFGSLGDYLQQDSGSIDTIIEFMNLHVRSRNKFKDLLIVKYEDLVQNPRITLEEVIRFVFGYEFKPHAISNAIEYCKFENMRKMEESGQSHHSLTLVDPKDDRSFKVRKGKIGGYKEELDEELLNFLNEKIKSELDPIFKY